MCSQGRVENDSDFITKNPTLAKFNKDNPKMFCEVLMELLEKVKHQGEDQVHWV